MLSASRAYEANIAAFNTAKGMVKSALSIGRV
jgi:flagellar basal body rod protein FlgC